MSTGSTTRRKSASTRPRPPARTSSSARPPAAASPTPASSRSAATAASRPTRPPLPARRLQPRPPSGPRIRSPRPHPAPPGLHHPSPPTATTSTSSPAVVGPPTSPRLPPLAAGGAQLGSGSLLPTLSQTLRSGRRRKRSGQRGPTTRSTGWVTGLPGRALRRPGTRRSHWLPLLRRGEITRKAMERRRAEGRRVSRSLERRGGRGRPRRRSASAPCSPLHQGRRRGSQTGGTRQGMCVDVRVRAIWCAVFAMDVG